MNTIAASKVVRGNLLGGGWRIGALAVIGVGVMTSGCVVEPLGEDEDIGTIELAGGPDGHNGTPLSALKNRHLKRANTDAAGITGAGETRPHRICGDAIHPTYCEVPAAWDVWQNAYPIERGKLLEALVHCAMPGDFYVYVPGNGGGNFTGMFGLAPGWKTNRLSVAQQEILSGCVLGLVNANNVEVPVAVIAPSSPEAPYDSNYRYMEGTFYGNLFLPSPTMIACGGIQEDGGDRVIGRYARVCTNDSNEPCGINVMGACNGGYAPGSTGYCAQWAGSGDGRYCAQARDDGAYQYHHPVTIYLKTNPVPLPGNVFHCGPGGDKWCTPEL